MWEKTHKAHSQPRHTEISWDWAEKKNSEIINIRNSVLLGKGPVHEAQEKALWDFRSYMNHKVAAEMIWLWDIWEILIYARFPGDSVGKASACNTEDLGSIPGSGRSPEEGNGNPMQVWSRYKRIWWKTWKRVWTDRKFWWTITTGATWKAPLKILKRVKYECYSIHNLLHKVYLHSMAHIKYSFKWFINRLKSLPKFSE